LTSVPAPSLDAATATAWNTWASSSVGIGSVVVAIAEYGIVLLPVALVTAWFLSRDSDRRLGGAVLTGMLCAAVAFGVGYVLERVLTRPRPFVELGLQPLFAHAADSSFPSDHTLIAAAMCAPLLFLRPPLGAALFIWVLVIGAARVASGVHYPSDIVGSLLLGIGLAWFVGRIIALTRRRPLPT
jgi:undecaprenyl-diphosphatase